MIAELLRLGLSDEEARTYLAALEVNGGPVSVIAKKAGVHRVSCYHTLENLREKRLVSVHTKNGVKHFSPEPPETLERLMQEKMALARHIIPELRTIQSSLGFKPKIRSYEGREGVERVFTESLTATKEILGYTNLQNIIQFFPDFFRNYTRERFEKGIKSRYLSPNTVESVHAIDPFLPETYDKNLLEILLVNKEQFPFENEVLVFGNTVGIVSLNRDELLGLLVESATFARTMRAAFDLSWLGATAFVAK